MVVPLTSLANNKLLPSKFAVLTMAAPLYGSCEALLSLTPSEAISEAPKVVTGARRSEAGKCWDTSTAVLPMDRREVSRAENEQQYTYSDSIGRPQPCNPQGSQRLMGELEPNHHSPKCNREG